MAYQPSAALLAAQAKTAARNPGFSTSFTPAVQPTQQAAPAPVPTSSSQPQPLPSIGSTSSPSLGAPQQRQNSGAAMTPQRAATLASNQANATAAGRTLGAPPPIKMTTGGSTINPATGGVSNASPTAPTLPEVDPLAQYQTGVQSAAELYQKSLQLSPEEIAAQTEADNLTTSYRTGNQDIADRGEPMYDIIGSQQSLENRYLNAQEPINAKLARLQAQRIANTNASKFSLDRADQALADAKTEARQATLDKQEADTAATARKDQALQFALENNIDKPFFSHNGTVYRTSDLKLIGTPAEAAQLGVNSDGSNVQKLVPQQSKEDYISVGEGSAVFDPNTGQMVYQNTKTYALDKPNAAPASIQEYEYAVANGYTGSFTDYKNSGTANKPLTETQAKDSLYATRTEQANGTIQALEGTIAKYNPTTFGLYKMGENTTIGNAYVPDEIKQIRQAERNFLNSVLRRESGAVISPTEFENGEKQYFPRPGDDATTLQQKAQNRQTVIDGLKASLPSSGGGSSPNDPLGLDNGGSVPNNARTALGGAKPSAFALASAAKYPAQSKGGQCVTFLHKIADFPSIGDGKNEKFASVDKIGIPKSQWKPQVGDIVITGDNPTYGHGFIINAILPNGDYQVTESNWNGNEKVTHNRIVKANSSSIYGAIRPKSLKLKSQVA